MRFFIEDPRGFVFMVVGGALLAAFAYAFVVNVTADAIVKILRAKPGPSVPAED